MSGTKCNRKVSGCIISGKCRIWTEASGKETRKARVGKVSLRLKKPVNL